MANHNELKRISATPQPNTVPYSDENGYLSAWLDNDPVITALKGENEFIGSVPTAPAPDTQSILTQFVVDTTGRQPRNGDEVAIEDISELWIFNGTSWVFFTTTVLNDATTTSKGVMQVGTGLLVSSGIVSVDSSIYWASRSTVSNSSATPSLAPAANTDYIFTNTLTSLTLSSVPSSSYYTTLTFTTGSAFTLSVPNSLQFFFLANNPTLRTNTTYKLVIVNGKCHVYYTGARQYPINKYTFTNPALTPSNSIATWTISDSNIIKDSFIRVYETSTGNTVEVDSTITNGQAVIKLYTESSISAANYTAVILG